MRLIHLSYLQNTQLELFSFLVCAILLFDILLHKEKYHFENKLFLTVLIANMVILLVDALGWAIEGNLQHSLNAIYFRLVLLYFMMNPLLPYLLLLYIDFQIYQDRHRLRKLFWPYMTPLIFIAILLIANPFTQILFHIDQNNVYHRGPLFNLFLLLVFSYLLYALGLIIANRNNIGRQHFWPLAIFPLPPLIGAILQVKFYGLALIWSGLTLSLIIIYIYVQNRQLNTDYLTGSYNRKQLDQYLAQKINNIEADQAFAAIMIDIDGFKKINDQFGHVIGDEALVDTAEILKKSLRTNDFLARYGGDEFMVILNINSSNILEEVTERINRNFANFNSSHTKPYELNVSMGYDIYEYGSLMSSVDFIERLDSLMYINKSSKTGQSVN